MNNKELEELAFVLYSANKLAKYYRDKNKKTNGLERLEAINRMVKLYDLKETVLGYFDPSEIHICKKEKTFSKLISEDSSEFNQLKGRNKILIRPDDKTGIYKKYISVSTTELVNSYFLYYKMFDFGFHVPLRTFTSIDAFLYKDLPQIKLPDDFSPETVPLNQILQYDEIIVYLEEFLKNKQKELTVI